MNLEILCGSHSERGRKEENQDCIGFRAGQDSHLKTKGIAAAIADGVSTSEYGGDAARACVGGFLSDYFSTPESWSVKKSAQQILNALNSWLYRQGLDAHLRATRICTLSALVCKSTTAHIFHIGDSRVYRLREGTLELLTTDHRTWVASNKSYLSRAMGSDLQMHIDYSRFSLEQGDIFLLTTDGIHDFVTAQKMTEVLLDNPRNPDKAAAILAHLAKQNDSPDNLSCLVLQVRQLPAQQAHEIFEQLTEQPFPPPLSEGHRLDGYRVIRELHASNRSQLYLAEDMDTGLLVALKTPSVNFVDDPAYIERFTMEEWVGRRLDNPHILKLYEPQRRRRFLYHVAEYLPGQTLRQWMHDNPAPALETVRDIVEQIAAGLQAFHRQEMLHQDLKPENIMVDRNGTWKIVDFGSTKVAGIVEIDSPVYSNPLQGTRSYTAPEYITGKPIGNGADIFSLGVITYEMLTGALPYGEAPTTWKKKSWQGLCYIPARDCNGAIPEWFDGALRKAVNPDPAQRYKELSEYLFDLRQPNKSLISRDNRPLLERDPLRFWRGTSLILFGIVLWLAYLLIR